MSDHSTWVENLKGCVNDCIDRLYGFFAANDNDEYEGSATDNSKIDVEIHLTIKAKK